MASPICSACGAVVPADNINLHRLRCRGMAGHTQSSIIERDESHHEWACSQCTLLNSLDASVCAACGQARNGSVPDTTDTYISSTITSNLAQERSRPPRRRRISHDVFGQTSLSDFGTFSRDVDAMLGSGMERTFANLTSQLEERSRERSRVGQRRLSMLHHNVFPGMGPDFFGHGSPFADMGGDFLDMVPHMDPYMHQRIFDPFAGELQRALAASEAEESRPRPASSQDVQALPTCALDASQLEGLPEESKECLICMEPFCEGEVLRTLPCLHRFHVGCIDRWFAQQGSCPICKHRLGEEDTHA